MLRFAYITAASYETLCSTTKKASLGFGGPRGTSVRPRQWGRKGGARTEAERYSARGGETPKAAGAERATHREQEEKITEDERGSEVTRRANAVGSFPLSGKERQAYNRNNHHVSRSVG